MTEQRIRRDNKVWDKWVKCPTCRQHTDVGNIAYVDDQQSESSTSSLSHTIEGLENSAASIVVQGSYGTKVYFLLLHCNNLQNIDIRFKCQYYTSAFAYFY